MSPFGKFRLETTFILFFDRKLSRSAEEPKPSDVFDTLGRAQRSMADLLRGGMDGCGAQPDDNPMSNTQEKSAT